MIFLWCNRQASRFMAVVIQRQRVSRRKKSCAVDLMTSNPRIPLKAVWFFTFIHKNCFSLSDSLVLFWSRCLVSKIRRIMNENWVRWNQLMICSISSVAWVFYAFKLFLFWQLLQTFYDANGSNWEFLYLAVTTLSVTAIRSKSNEFPGIYFALSTFFRSQIVDLVIHVSRGQEHRLSNVFVLEVGNSEGVKSWMKLERVKKSFSFHDCIKFLSTVSLEYFDHRKWFHLFSLRTFLFFLQIIKFTRRYLLRWCHWFLSILQGFNKHFMVHQ